MRGEGARFKLGGFLTAQQDLGILSAQRDMRTVLDGNRHALTFDFHELSSICVAHPELTAISRLGLAAREVPADSFREALKVESRPL
jgi:hypothetical protein